MNTVPELDLNARQRHGEYDAEGRDVYEPIGANVTAFYQAIAKALDCEAVDIGVKCGQKWGAKMKDAEGRVFDLRPDWRTGKRIEVDGDYPTTKRGGYMASAYNGETNPKITVSATRPPEAIAKEIGRRFFPDFRERWAKVAKRAADYDDYEDNQAALLDRLADRIDGSRKPSDKKSSTLWAPGFYRRIQAGKDCVTLEFYSLPAELAFQVVEVVEKWRKEHGDED